MNRRPLFTELDAMEFTFSLYLVEGVYKRFCIQNEEKRRYGISLTDTTFRFDEAMRLAVEED